MVPEKGYLGLTYVMIAGGEQTVLVQKLYRGRWRRGMRVLQGYSSIQARIAMENNDVVHSPRAFRLHPLSESL